MPALGAGLIVGGLAAIGGIVSLFLPWREGGVHVSDVPVSFLWDSTSQDTDPSLLIVLIPVVALLAIGAVLPFGAGIRLFAGLALLAIALVFAWQVDNTLDRFPGADLGDALDTGVYVAGISGVVGIASGLVPSGWRRRDTVVDEAA
jgi:hypothetical protein